MSFIQYSDSTSTASTASATATATATASASAISTGNTSEENIKNAINSASISAYFALAPPLHPGAGKSKTCEQVCLSCIDFRFIPDYVYNQNIKGDEDNYDQFVIAGASLGYNGIPGYENWILYGDQTIQLAYDLHKISEVIIYDHLECGAYGLVYTPEELAGDGEYKLHIENLNKAQATLLKKYSFITKVSKKIVGLDGKIIDIP